MGRLVGYMANRHDRLGAALHQERGVVAPPPAVGPTGWGLGFYQGGEVLHKKRPQFDSNGFDWESVTRDVRTDCAVLHLRQPTVGDFRSHNTHPFRMRSWIFAHTGTIQRFEAIEERLRASLPDFVNRNIRGKTDSEVLFHVILSFLHDGGNLDKLDVAADDGKLAEIKGLVEKPAPKDAPSTLSIIGRYVLLPEIFAELDRQERGAGNEIQLTDAMAWQIGRAPFHGLRFDGRRFDCGDKAGFLEANLAFALAREDLASQVRKFLGDYV